MSMPFYVAPEQFMKDKADFARKNIARGRPLVATVYLDGILICAENTSKTLHKVSEIYDRIAFAGVGRYNEFDQLRRAGVQHADVKGYQFSREDVDARALANLYAQYIGNVFTHEMKPLEVEILVCEVGSDPAGDQLFHILYDIHRIPQIPSINFWARTGQTSERRDDSRVPHVRAILDPDDGHIMVLMTHNTDFGDAFEREGDDHEYFLRFAPEGYAFGVNALIYSMTH